uniref:Secreted protein n=1 Tax=Arion vulgaris TaxID=1028688 RepID=A0A0B7ASF2_9EUPU
MYVKVAVETILASFLLLSRVGLNRLTVCVVKDEVKATSGLMAVDGVSVGNLDHCAPPPSARNLYLGFYPVKKSTPDGWTDATIASVTVME